MRILHLWIRLLATLPFSVLYRLSDLLFFLLYYIIRYRRTIVRQNLIRAFPEKPISEIKTIERRFYLNFCDNLVETIKMLSHNSEEILKRYQLDTESYLHLATYNQPIILCLGHQFNWEWGSWALPLLTPFQVYAFYLPLSNKQVDHLLYRIRSSMGTTPIPANHFLKHVKAIRETRGLCVMIADQSPANLETAYWVPFFSRLTPFLSGMEKLARLLNCPVAFATIRKIRRGLYQVHTSLLVEQPARYPDGTLTQLFAQRLEASIREQPENWLWSHRRWKHAKD